MKKSILRRAITTLATTCLTLCVASAALAQRGGTARYVYDGNGWPHAGLLGADALTVSAFTPRECIFGAGAGAGAGRGREGEPISAPAAPGVQAGPPQGTTRITPISAVSVQYGSAAPALQTISPAVSVDRGYPGRQSAAFNSVSVTTGPYVTSVSPAQVSRGTTVTLTITGENLAGATAIYFINFAGVHIPVLTSTNVVANGGGTEVTATVFVPLIDAVSPGTYVLVVATPVGDSLTTPDGGRNRLQIN